MALLSFLLPETGLRPLPWAAVTTVACLLGLGVATADQIQRLDWTLDDRLVRIITSDTPPADGVVVVAIDEPSFAELALPWPWPRRLHAALVDRLARGGARTIVFDIVFDAPGASPDDDALFVEAVRRAGSVVVAADRAVVDDASYTLTQWAEPFPALAEAAAGTGAVGLPLDPDGVVRRTSLTIDGRPSLAAAAAARLAPPARTPPATDDLLVAYRGAPRHGIRTVSYYQALEADTLLPRDVFRGKTVFVGRSLAAAPTTEETDAFMTPIGLRTAGVEIHATVLDTLARGAVVADPFSRRVWLLALCLVVGAAAGSVAYRLPPLSTAGVLVVAGVLWLAGAWVARSGEMFRLAVVGPWATALVVYGVTTGYRYAVGTRERQLIRRAFEHYLAPSIVEQMLRDPSKLSLGGEEYEASVLFTDLEGFTSISEHLPPAEVRAHLSHYLTVMTDEVLAGHGTLDRFIGDAILAYFGCPIADARHPAQACATAIAMQVRMRELNARWAAQGLPQLRMRIGVNTGRVVAGNMGTETVFHYTIIGDAVNLASRLEGVNKQYGTWTLVGEETWHRTAGAFAGREVDRVRVKGRSQALAIYELAGPAGEPDADRDERFAAYADALAAYRASDWSSAAARLDALLAKWPDDGPSRTMRDRVARYAATPPAADWGGVWVLESK